MQEEAFPAEASIIWIGEVATALDHPGTVRLAEDARDRHPSFREIDHEQDGEARQPTSGPHVDREEIRAARTPWCVRRISFQAVRFWRSGAGSIPCCLRMLAMVPRLT